VIPLCISGVPLAEATTSPFHCETCFMRFMRLMRFMRFMCFMFSRWCAPSN
jgi:hypothetical protein